METSLDSPVDEDPRLADKARPEGDNDARLILDGIPGLVAALTPDGDVELVNRQVLEYCGGTFEDMKQWATNDTVHPEDLPRVIDIISKSLVSGEPYDIEERIRRFDGVYRWFQVRGRAFRDASGHILRWYVLLTDIDERKRAEVELKRAYDSFADAERLSKAGNFTADIVPDRHIWSEEMYRIFEIEPGTKISVQRVRDSIHPEDLPTFDADFARYLGGEPIDHVFRIITPRGKVKYVHSIGHVETPAGTPVFIGALQDVTESKLTEQALRESERESRLIVDSIPGLVAIMSPAGEIERVSEQATAYLGRTIEEGQHWATTTDLAHPEDVSRVTEIVARAIATGDPFEFEERVRRFDGVYRWFQVRGVPLRDSNGAIIRWYSLLTDIEDRKRAEDELRRNEAFLSQGQRLSSTGTYSWYLDTDEVTLSEELRRIYEVDNDEVPTVASLFGKIHPEDLPGLIAKREEIRANPVPHEHQLRLRMPDGRIKYVRTFAIVIRHENGRLESLGAAQDVTEYRLSEAALDKVRSELAQVTRVMSLSALTASIAHEVNQPLSGIITNASTCVRMLDADPPNVAGARETAKRTIRDGNRASEVIARLRALFSRKEFTFEPLDLNDAAREVIALSFGDFQRNRVILQGELAPNLATVNGDRVQLQQVILNLLRNASDAMAGVEDRPRQVLIKTENDEGEGVRVSVRDSGVGLAEGMADKMFDTFFTTKAEGMGIGLSVSRSIVASHHGRLWAQANDGPGATFSFWLPSTPDT